MEWLNRAGIVLNFVAAFLVAPELIGIERIRKLEKTIKNWLFLSMESIYRQQKFIKPYLSLFREKRLLGFFIITLLDCISAVLIRNSSTYYLGLVLLILVCVFLYLQILLGYIKTSNSRKTMSVLGLIVVAPLVTVLSAGILLLLPFFLLLVIVIYLLGKIALYYFYFIVRVLDGEGKMRTVIIVMGIILFILGNIFQFTATF